MMSFNINRIGGKRLSGYGRYHGPECLCPFPRIRTIMRASDHRAREINWFRFTSRIRRQLASLLRFHHKPTGTAARQNRMLQPLLIGLVFSIALPAQPKAQAHLTVDVRLATSAHGELAYLVFDSPSGFPDDHEKAIRRGFLPILADARQLHIDIDVPPGTYAVSVYEDLNGNHKLDRNIFGIPREPAGASNNPPARMGPPRFNECSFRLGSAAQTISITMVRGS